MADYFAAKGIDFDELAQELKEEFNPDHCISVNDDKGGKRTADTP